MKRPNSSDSLGALMSICPNSSVDVDEKKQENSSPMMYGRDFQTMLQGGFDDEECSQLLVSEKKRRLGVDQVKALEKNFEVENKLEPERKVKLAQELGLQPRQVAVWFQNRRARWKTKQLERDYGLLKTNHDALIRKFDTLQKENHSLLLQIRELKSKLNNADDDSKIRIKAEPSLASDTDREKIKLEENGEANLELNNKEVIIGCATSAFSDLKDGVLSSDDSNSSAILNNEDINTNSPNDQFLDIENGPSPNSSYALDMNFGFSDCKASAFVKIEEHSFLDEESCSSLFSDDQAPTLHWYCSDEWK